jgi:cellobiose phosphorylase
VGEHNHIRLRNADWNDALDMAPHRGESVAFSNAYAGNLIGLAELIEEQQHRGYEEFQFLQEMEILFTEDMALYEDPDGKQKLLEEYLGKCMHHVSGNSIRVDAGELADNLRKKGQWMQEHIRRTEWIEEDEEKGWFNVKRDFTFAISGILSSVP